MIDRLYTRCLLSPSDVPASDDRLRVVGTFNPGVAETPGGVVLIVRVAEGVTERRDGQLAAPRYATDGALVVDWLDAAAQDTSDPRFYVDRQSGRMRLRFVSHLRVYRYDGESVNAGEGVTLRPQGEYETYGVEDPRVTKIGGAWYITYVGASDRGITTCLLSTTDFTSFRRHGVIFAPDNKDVLLFPDKVFGDYVAMHRPMPAYALTAPRMWIARSADLIRWGGHQLVDLGSVGTHRDRVGGGTPPIRTERGWLTLYHGSDKTMGEAGAGTYSAGALLLEHDSPATVTARTPEPFFKPEADFERTGFVNNVVFPTGVIERGDQLEVYYGAADTHVAVTAYRRDDLMGLLEPVG